MSDLSKDQIDLLKNSVCKGATDDQLKLFIEICKRTKLDPFTKQIYGIPNGGRLQVQISIDGMRLIAQRSGKYRGQVGPYFCGKDGIWVEVWNEDGPPVACKVGVLHADFDKPVFAVCKFSAYGQNSGRWKIDPDGMLAKTTESLALRKTFPMELSGLYSSEEMEQAIPASRPAPMITASTEAPPPDTLKDVSETPFKQQELLPPETEGRPEWETYRIPFGPGRGKTIKEFGVLGCLETIKTFEGKGKGLPPMALKLKDMVDQAIQQGQT